MHRPADWIHYEERLNRVTSYIYGHLDDELDLIKIAEIAYLSPYHFHRIYRAAKGETIFATVQRLRLYRAASALALTSLPIKQISNKRVTKTFNLSPAHLMLFMASHPRATAAMAATQNFYLNTNKGVLQCLM